MLTGSNALPVSADAVMFPVAPTLTVATAKAPEPFVPGMSTMPPVAAAKATMSGTEVIDAESSKVFSPVLIGAGSLFAQSKLNCTSVGEKGAVSVTAKIKLCSAPAIFAAVLGNPVT